MYHTQAYPKNKLMEEKLDDLQSKIWKKTASLDSTQRNYWSNISISLTGINHSVNQFLQPKNPEISVCYAKILIMEIWNVREFLRALKIDISELDNNFPNIKKLRDSYAHIDERINGTKKEFNKRNVNLNWEKKSIADGAITSNDGINWLIKPPLKRQFNMQFNGNSGMMSIFGIVNDFLICNSENDLIEFEINQNTTKIILEIINKASE